MLKFKNKKGEEVLRIEDDDTAPRRIKSAKKKYVKKPVVIEAFQTNEEIAIETLEGTMIASPGDYVITGIKGETYPCKPDIFHESYEEIEEEE